MSTPERVPQSLGKGGQQALWRRGASVIAVDPGVEVGRSGRIAQRQPFMMHCRGWRRALARVGLFGWAAGAWAVSVAAPLTDDSPDHTQGEAIYREHCAVCHGDRGDGMTRARRGLNPPPRDFTSAVAAAELSRRRMIESVTHGRPATAMMSFKQRLSADEIAAVVDFIRERFMRQPASVDARQRALEQGKRIYTSNCAVCHGDDGSGAMWTQTSLNPPPRNFTAAAARQELSRERMISSVTYGRPGTAMMAFQKRLSPEDIGAVVDYIRASFMSASAAPASQRGHPVSVPPQADFKPADMTLAFPNGLVGDYEAGKKFYAGNCSPCHGLNGEGNGPRSAFIVPPPRNFRSEQSRMTLNRPTLIAAIAMGKRGTPMPAWSKVLSDQRLADVAEYVFQAFVRNGGETQAPPSSVDTTEKKKVD